jgi:hypothetical protein
MGKVWNAHIYGESNALFLLIFEQIFNKIEISNLTKPDHSPSIFQSQKSLYTVKTNLISTYELSEKNIFSVFS